MNEGGGGQPFLSEDCLAMCDHMGVPTYVVNGKKYLNLSGKQRLPTVETDSLETSGSETSAVAFGSPFSIGHVKGTTDPKLFELLDLIATDSKLIRGELAKVTTQLEAQVQTTALQGGALTRVIDQLGELQTTTAGRIDAMQKEQKKAAEDQTRALARMDEALAKMRAGDTAVVGPPSAPMQT
jgi:hypothetical protein